MPRDLVARERAAIDELLAAQEVGRGGHHGERNAQRLAVVKPLLDTALLEAGREPAIEQLGVGHALDRDLVARLGDQIGQIEHLAQAPPLRPQHAGDADPAILGAIDPGRIGRPVTVPAQRAAAPRRR